VYRRAAISPLREGKDKTRLSPSLERIMTRSIAGWLRFYVGPFPRYLRGGLVIDWADDPCN
jgi:hypothetical protein